jgi:hypothetical protein
MTKPQIPFALAQLRISSSPAFPAIVLDDAAVIPVDAVLPLAARLGLALTEADSLDGLLRNWDHNFQALCAVVMALDDAEAGKYFRSAVSSLEFFTQDAPLSAPRQILSQNTLADGNFIPRLASTLVGPSAKVLIPPQSDGLWAEAKLGAVIARPLHRATLQEAEDAIAGYVTLSDYTVAADWEARNTLAAKQGPTLLAAGPYLLPAAFADDQQNLQCVISFNGESRLEWSGPQIAPIARTLSELSQQVQLFPGDLVAVGPKHSPTGQTRLEDGDIIEAAVSGLGRQTTNTIRES